MMTSFQKKQEYLHKMLFEMLNLREPIPWVLQAMKMLILHDNLKEMNE
jgi:hypothetical protein